MIVIRWNRIFIVLFEKSLVSKDRRVYIIISSEFIDKEGNDNYSCFLDVNVKVRG